MFMPCLVMENPPRWCFEPLWDQRGEEPLTLKSEAVETLTSEGASILLGVLLADMTGSVLRLAGANGGNPCSYYPASFVEKVLK